MGEKLIRAARVGSCFENITAEELYLRLCHRAEIYVLGPGDRLLSFNDLNGARGVIVALTGEPVVTGLVPAEQRAADIAALEQTFGYVENERQPYPLIIPKLYTVNGKALPKTWKLTGREYRDTFEARYLEVESTTELHEEEDWKSFWEMWIFCNWGPPRGRLYPIEG